MLEEPSGTLVVFSELGLDSSWGCDESPEESEELLFSDETELLLDPEEVLPPLFLSWEHPVAKHEKQSNKAITQQSDFCFIINSYLRPFTDYKVTVAILFMLVNKQQGIQTFFAKVTVVKFNTF